MAATPKIIVIPIAEDVVPPAPEPYVLKESLAVRRGRMYRPQLA